MSHPVRHYLIFKILLFNLLLFLLLAGVTVGVMVWGFGRANQQITLLSIDAVTEREQMRVLQMIEREAQISELTLARAADMVVSTAAHLTSGDAPPWTAQQLQQTGNRHYIDPSPTRITDVYIGQNVPIDDLLLADLGYTSRLDDIAPILMQNSEDVSAIYTVSPQGLTRYYPPKNIHVFFDADLNVSDLTLYQQITPAQNPDRRLRWTSPYIDDADLGLIVTACQPLYVADIFRGAACIDVSVRELIERLDQIDVSADGFVMMTGRNDEVIAVSSAGANWNIMSPLRQSTAPSTDVSVPPELDTILARVQDGTPLFQGQINGRTVFVAHTRMETTDWSLVSVIPLATIQAPAQVLSHETRSIAGETVRVMLLVIGLVFVGSLGLLVWLNRVTVVVPLQQLANGTRRIAAGDYGVQLPKTSEDELGQLAAAFNAMAKGLATSELAVHEERQRLSRELHDEVSQSVYGITLLTETARRALANNQIEAAQSQLVRVGEIGKQALKEIRLLLYALRPDALEQDGLIGALRHRLDTVERRAGITVQLDDETGDLPITSDIEIALYRVAQEALNNALKHAQAAEIHVRLWLHDTCLCMEIRDNGIGFDASQITGGVGLASMRERIHVLGGDCQLTTAAGAGVSITVRIPLLETTS